MINETDSLGILGSSASPAFQSERCQLFMVAGGGWPGGEGEWLGRGRWVSHCFRGGKFAEGVNQVKVDHYKGLASLKLCHNVSVVFEALFCLFFENHLTWTFGCNHFDIHVIRKTLCMQTSVVWQVVTEREINLTNCDKSKPSWDILIYCLLQSQHYPPQHSCFTILPYCHLFWIFLQTCITWIPGEYFEIPNPINPWCNTHMRWIISRFWNCPVCNSM